MSGNTKRVVAVFAIGVAMAWTGFPAVPLLVGYVAGAACLWLIAGLDFPEQGR